MARGGGDAQGGAEMLAGAPSGGAATAAGGVSPATGGAGSVADAGESSSGAAGAAGEGASEGELFASVNPGSCTSLHLDLASEALFYTDSTTGTVARISFETGKEFVLASKRPHPTLLVVGGDYIYWLADDENAIYSNYDKTPLISTATKITGLALDEPNQTLYYSTGAGIRGYRLYDGYEFQAAVELGGQRPIALALLGGRIAFTAQPSVVDLARVDGALPVSCVDLDNQRCLRAGTNVMAVLYEQIEALDNQFYWAREGTLSATELADGLPTHVVASAHAPADRIVSFAIANGTAYTSDTAGYLQATPFGPSPHGAARVITRAQPAATQLVANAHYLFWTQQCEIWRLRVQ